MSSRQDPDEPLRREKAVLSGEVVSRGGSRSAGAMREIREADPADESETELIPRATDTAEGADGRDIDADDADWKPEPAAEPESKRTQVEAEPKPKARPRLRLVLPPLGRSRRAVLLSVAVAGALILLVPRYRLIDDPAGLWLMLGAPVAVYFGTARRVVSTPDGAALLAVGFAIVHDLLVLLGLDLILPALGDSRPLELRPITVALAVVTILVAALAPESEALGLAYGWRRRGFGPVLCIGAVVLLCSVAGAIRLNNGFGSGVSMTAMVLIVASLIFLLFKQNYSVGAIELGIYFAAAAILLLTSLRGWLITGHDIQTEYAYFSDVYSRGRWVPGTTSNAYYACLSVTMLPVAFAHLTAISDVNVFKVIEPLLFATTPVLLFRGVRNVASHNIAVLSAIFFTIFPTFSTDMAYMSRQEIAFILTGCAVLLVTEQNRGIRARRLAFAVLMAGIVVSHYSTAYVVIVVTGIAVGADLLMRLWLWIRRRNRGARGSGARTRRASRLTQRAAPGLVPWWMVVLSVAMALIWAGPVTHTAGQVQSTITSAISQLKNGASSGYFAQKPSDSQLLAQYKQSAVAITATDRSKSVYWPLSLVDEYQTSVVGTQYQPLTSAGQGVQNAGIDVSNANVLLRSLDDRSYEALILLGLFAVWFAGRRLFVATKDQVLLAIGGLGMLVVLTVVPQLTVDYGSLRAFEEGMFFFAPFLAAGLVWLCGLFRKLARPATAVGVTVIASTMTGVVPQLTGGYYGILSMANEGQYYDIHYPTRSELDGAQWLNSLVIAEKQKTGQAPVVQADYYTADEMQTVFTGPTLPDTLPQWLRPGSYVFVGPTTIREDEVSNRLNGQIVTYRYPTQLLDIEYNRIYASGGAEIYGPEMNN